MPSLGASRSRWPVTAWLRLRLPPAPAPVLLTKGPPPPPEPPLDLLRPEPIATDPRRRIFAFEEEIADGLLRLVWDSDDPDILEAELRSPLYDERPPPEEVARFWAAVKARVGALGPLPVDGADPRP